MDTKKIRVLLIEDEPLIARHLKKICTNLGYTVVGTAYNSTQALDKLHGRDYDLVLTDINIDGDRDGVELGEIIKNQYKKPFIYVTSYADKATMNRAKETCPNGYIVKPFDEKDIYTSIEIAIFNAKQESKPEFTKKYLIEKLQVHLTDREFEIIQDIVNGVTNPQMATKYFVSENTVKSHIKNIYKKLNAHSKAEMTKIVLS